MIGDVFPCSWIFSRLFFLFPFSFSPSSFLSPALWEVGMDVKTQGGARQTPRNGPLVLFPRYPGLSLFLPSLFFLFLPFLLKWVLDRISCRYMSVTAGSSYLISLLPPFLIISIFFLLSLFFPNEVVGDKGWAWTEMRNK